MAEDFEKSLAIGSPVGEKLSKPYPRDAQETTCSSMLS